MDILVLSVMAVLGIGGAFFVLVSAAAMLRVDDAVSRVNVLSPATGMGLPMIVLAAFVNDVHVNGFDPIDLIKVLVAVAGFIIMSSVASNTLGRSAYRSGAPLSPRLSPNELGEPPRR
jgi:multicomponent Na+:H+ antiporter subunit G